MKENNISIIIADDYDLIRAGLNKMLSCENNITSLYECSNGKEAIELLKLKKADAVLLDIDMPIMNGLEALEIIKRTNTDTKVIIITEDNNVNIFNTAIELGVDGYLLKGSSSNEIMNAITNVLKGEKYIDKNLVNKILFRSKKNSLLDSLTDRELYILLEISKGLKNKEIAKKLYLSEKTVKNYVTNLFRKIDVYDRVQAAIFALKNNVEQYFYIK